MGAKQARMALAKFLGPGLHSGTGSVPDLNSGSIGCVIWLSLVSIGSLNRLCQPTGDRKRGQVKSHTLSAREAWRWLPDHLHAASVST